MLNLPSLPWLKSIVRPRVVEVGWLLAADKALFVWDEPRRIRHVETPPKHAKALTYCPATLDHDSRIFEVPCPIDVRLGFRFGPDGKPQIANLDGEASGVRNNTLSAMLKVVDRKEWRHPDRPVIQIITPYVFLADEPVYMTQTAPSLHYGSERLPGVMVSGRLPIHIWPRQMMWAFEWYDVSAPLVLRRGEPWFYVRFEANDPTKPFRLVEAEFTQPLKEYLQGISAVSNYVNRTYSLFKTAERRRPKALLVRKVR